MISKAQIKYIKSLQIKKYRKQEQCFVVEGKKSVEELFRSDFEVITVVASIPYLERIPDIPQGAEVLTATSDVLQSLGEFQTNDDVIAVARMQHDTLPEIYNDEYVLVLDSIRDPGNLGTIMRTADWYGIKTLLVSPDTADFYNPKVISASMGSFTRVRLHYVDLVAFLTESKRPVYGTFLDGDNVHGLKFEKGGFIVIGNEGSGISDAVQQLVTHRITIPRFGKAESLNASIASAVVLDNLRRSG